MSTEPLDAPPERRPTSRLNLALTALVLGVVSIGLSFVLVGGLVSVIGMVFALMHLLKRRDQPRGMAIGGLILSVAGLAASIGFGVLYFAVIDGAIRSFTNGGTAHKWVGKESPDFTVTTLDGEVFKLSDFRGRRVVVDYWETWCGPCIQEIPEFNRLRAAVSDQDLALIGISTERESVLRPFLSEHETRYPIASVKNLPAPFSNIMIIPTTFFIDRNGIIQSVLVGYHDFDVLKEHATAEDYEPPNAPAP